MKHLKRVLAGFFSCILLTGLFITGPISAQNNATPAPGNGLKVGPPRYELEIDKGGSQTVELFIENIISDPISIAAVANDFIPADNETGEPRILLDEELDLDSSFKPIVTLPSDPIVLGPN